MQQQHTVHDKLRREREAKEKILLDAKRSRNAMKQLDDKCVRITHHKNNDVILQLIKEYTKRIQKRDTKNSNVIQLLIATSVKEILNIGMKSST